MEKIKNLRKKINKIDKNIILLIAERYKIVKEIRKEKSKNKLTITDEKREKWLKEYYKKISLKLKLNHLFIEKLFSLIIAESKKIQKEKK